MSYFLTLNYFCKDNKNYILKSFTSKLRKVNNLAKNVVRENTEHQQEKLFSPLKELSGNTAKKLRNHWSTHFYEHVFTQIDETKFERLYHDGYSRPNKPVNELVSLEIIKHLMNLSDEELEHAYIFDFRAGTPLARNLSTTISARRRSPTSGGGCSNTRKTQDAICCTKSSRTTASIFRTNSTLMPVLSEWIQRWSRPISRSVPGWTCSGGLSTTS